VADRTLRVSDDLALPLEAVTETFAIFGKRGKGKTNAAVVLVEELFRAGLPVVVLDPIGVWWGLKASSDGSGPGLPIYVFGGQHGDLPLTPTGGAVMADLVVEQRIAMILDLKGFTGGERSRFVTDFAKRMLATNSEPVHVVIEEADAFVPQRPYPGEQEMLGAMDRMVRWGRSSGIGCTLVTQRSAKVNKDVTTQAEVLVAFGITGPQDRDAIDDWIKYHDGGQRRHEVLESLASLPPGTAWLWSPGWLETLQQVRFRRRETFDSAATPRVGGQRVTPTLAAVDLDRLRERMAATIEQAEANDPKALRRRVADLERQLATERKRATSPEVRVERVEVMPPDMAERLATWADLLERAAGVLNHEAASARELAGAPQPKTSRAPKPSRRATLSPPPGVDMEALKRAADRRLSDSQQRILDSLAWLEGVGIAPANRVQLAGFAGQSPTGGGYANNLGRLRSLGLIDYPGPKLVELVDAGRDAARPPDVPPTSEALQEQVCGMLSGSQIAILRALIAAYPRDVTRSDLAAKVGQSKTGGGFANNLGRLRTLGWIDYPSPGSVVALPVLFLERVS
jgi:hypothetical protein